MKTAREEFKEELKEEKIKEKNEYHEEMAKYFPPYTRGEEIFNAVSHIVGGALGILALVIGVVFAVIYQKTTGAILSMIFFGLSIMLLYTMSAIYHFLYPNKAKRVFRVFDHCTIYVLICGTYAPVCFILLNNYQPWNFVIFAIVSFLCLIGVVFNAIMLDKKPVKIMSQILYLIVGWLIVCFMPWLIESVGMGGALLILFGGISYTIGVIFFALGKKVRYFHSIWHIFDILGTALQFLGILIYGIIL